MENIEIEYKVMINEEGYAKLLLHYKNKLKTYSQINYYFDTLDDKIAKNKLSLRIRFVNNKYIATLKENAPNGGRLEHEFEVQDNKKESIPLPIIEILSKHNISIDELYMFASLKTIRSEIKYYTSLICIDYNIYNNKEDFEIECESSSLENGKEIIEKLLNKLNIFYKTSTLSKVARAKASIRKV